MPSLVKVRYWRALTMLLYGVGSEKEATVGERCGCLEDIRVDKGLLSCMFTWWRRSTVFLCCESNKFMSSLWTWIPKKWWKNPRSLMKNCWLSWEMSQFMCWELLHVSTISSTYKRMIRMPLDEWYINKLRSAWLEKKPSWVRKSPSWSNQALGAYLSPYKALFSLHTCKGLVESTCLGGCVI